MEWISVKDRPPEKPGEYYVWHPDINPYDMVAFFSEYLQEWNTRFINYIYPTHWRPITPPKEDVS